MAKHYLSLKPTEQSLTTAAAQLYAAYVIAGRVPDGAEHEWMDRAIRESIELARKIDDAVQADGEFD